MEFNNILNLIKPTEEERNRIYSIINEFIKILGFEGLEPFLGGSFAKDTWLRTDFDVDLFLLFENEKNMSDEIEKVLKKYNLNYERIKGSRDYFKVFYKGLEFEVVPVLKIKDPSEAKNSTDLSIFHVKYILEKIKEKPGINDEIRLMKIFAKNIGVYGAESYIRGFSGYALELIVIYYGSFYNAIKNISYWKPKVIIDIEKYYNNFEEIKKVMSKDKIKSPIIIVDPTNKYRNVSASVSIEKFSEFIYYSKLFLKDNNKEKYFLNKIKIDEEDIKNKSKIYEVSLIKLIIEGKSNNRDIKNSKALRLFNDITRWLNFCGFYIFNRYMYFSENKLYGYILVYPDKLPKYFLKKGPYVWSENLEEFLSKHINEEIIIKNGRVYSISPRKIINLEDCISYILNSYKKSIEERANYLNIEINNRVFEVKNE